MPSRAGFPIFVQKLAWSGLIDEQMFTRWWKPLISKPLSWTISWTLRPELPWMTGTIQDVGRQDGAWLVWDCSIINRALSGSNLGWINARLQFAIQKFLNQWFGNASTSWFKNASLEDTVLDIHYRLRTEIPRVYALLQDDRQCAGSLWLPFTQRFKELVFVEGKVSSASPIFRPISLLR